MQASQLFEKYPNSKLCAFVYLLLADLPSARMSLYDNGVVDWRDKAKKMLSKFDQDCLGLFEYHMQGNREGFFRRADQLSQRDGRKIIINNFMKTCAFMVPSEWLPELAKFMESPRLLDPFVAPAAKVTVIPSAHLDTKARSKRSDSLESNQSGDSGTDMSFDTTNPFSVRQ